MRNVIMYLGLATRVEIWLSWLRILHSLQWKPDRLVKNAKLPWTMSVRTAFILLLDILFKYVKNLLIGWIGLTLAR